MGGSSICGCGPTCSGGASAARYSDALLRCRHTPSYLHGELSHSSTSPSQFLPARADCGL